MGVDTRACIVSEIGLHYADGPPSVPEFDCLLGLAAAPGGAEFYVLDADRAGIRRFTAHGIEKAALFPAYRMSAIACLGDGRLVLASGDNILVAAPDFTVARQI